jgi:hypothetical protein
MTNLSRILILTFLFTWTSTSGQVDNVSALRQFAENYEPKNDSNQFAANLPSVPDKIKNSFPTLRQKNKKELEQYLTLIFLKIYRSHMECCHQSYELRTSKATHMIDSIGDPLIYEYNLIIKKYNPNTLIEFVPSNIGYDWTKKNPSLLKYNAIKKEYDIIKQIETNIDKGIYWDNK